MFLERCQTCENEFIKLLSRAVNFSCQTSDFDPVTANVEKVKVADLANSVPNMRENCHQLTNRCCSFYP